MAVAGSGKSGGKIVQACDYVNVVSERSQWCETGCEAVAGAGLGGNPIALGDSVAIEPQYKAALDGSFRHFARWGRLRGVSVARRVEHGYEGRQSNPRAAPSPPPRAKSSGEHKPELPSPHP